MEVRSLIPCGMAELQLFMMVVVQAFNWDNGKAPAFSGDFGNTTGDSFSYESGPFVGTVEYTLYSDQDAAYLSIPKR